MKKPRLAQHPPTPPCSDVAFARLFADELTNAALEYDRINEQELATACLEAAMAILTQAARWQHSTP